MPRRAVNIRRGFFKTRRRRPVRGVRGEHRLAGFALTVLPRDALGFVEFLLNLQKRVRARSGAQRLGSSERARGGGEIARVRERNPRAERVVRLGFAFFFSDRRRRDDARRRRMRI
jgi:hypothetical protein